MSEERKAYCPECDEEVVQPDTIDRRNFIRVIGERTAALVALGGAAGSLSSLREAAEVKSDDKPNPTEGMINELYANLSDAQKKEVDLPWDDAAGQGKLPTRMGMYNAPILQKRIGQSYTKPQQELLER